jgi:tetratricopeptide (TPR) repeat protein
LLSACSTQPILKTPSDTLPTPSPALIPAVTPTPSVVPKLQQSKIISSLGHYSQTFNNCGPATYSMLLLYQDIKVSQKILGDELRPYQIPNGDNDDKSVTMEEIAAHAPKYNLSPYYRPNGTLDLLKRFIATDSPVALRVWLNDKDDIGHFIIVRGYDDSTQQVFFDDSYYGPNRSISYQTLLSRWQPFNYEYLVLTKNTQQIETILGDQVDLQTSWQNSILRNQADQSTYSLFNLSVSYYEVGDYQKSVEYYEKVSSKLPRRMLWYQLQPIQAYLKLNNHKKVFELTDNILNNQNRAYSELYYIRAQSYIAQGQNQLAKEQLELAIKYNVNYEKAKQMLQTI